MTSYQREDWDSFYRDAEPLMRSHQHELRPGTRFAPDESACAAAVRSGVAELITARQGRRLVGYSTFYVAPSLETKGDVVATQGPWFVDPENRSTLVPFRLMQTALRSLESRGVDEAYPHHWLVGDSPKAQPIFRHLGAVPVELVYWLKLKRSG